MEQQAEPASTLSPTKRALLALKEMQARVDTLERAANEPIAIIGLGCRFPGGSDDPSAFWQLLSDGVDAIDEVPPDRWDAQAYYDPSPDARGMMRTRYGGFIGQRDTFDTTFFRITPREAASLDPQQRLALEVSWEALEHAGIAPEALFGSATGVFLGMTNFDHSISLLRQAGREQIDVYFGTGSAMSVAAGRISYMLGLTGPSMVVDTACSSSLVAVHLACQSLRNRECDTALAGGVNMLSAPEVSINLSQAGMLAPDGRCKTFDASADGYTRGEGCGMIVLKRLSDALADDDPILALIRGSAINQDGPSGGLTVPNGPSQEKVIRQALARSGSDPADIQYIEAHGTGTSLGDPIEIGALANVFGGDRPADRPLIVGSVKTNIGHLESAAGIAGLIKVVLALHQEIIPPHLHFNTPNPHIPWQRLPLTVPTTAQPWERTDRPRMAGVSSFGFSGTNAHVIIEEPPIVERPAAEVERPAQLLTLSATSEAAMAALAARYREHLSRHPEQPTGDLCFTAHTGRSHFEHRLSVVGASSDALRESLDAFLAGKTLPGVISGQARRNAQPKIAFLFTGQGSQYIGMGRELYETEPTFRRTLDRCDALLRPYLQQPLLSVLYPADSADSPLDETSYTQAALFALEYALAELWQSWGILPAALLGHSVGEYVAACIAGVFSLEDGLRLIAERGRLMQALPANGAMAAVFADEARVTAAIQPYADTVSIAALNSPRNCVIAGASESIAELRACLEADGIETRPLRVAQAFHSPLIEPMLAEFGRIAATVQYSQPRIPVISNLTGQPAGAEIATPDYWVRHARQPVRFAAGIESLHQQAIDVFVEIGPAPTLLALSNQILPGAAVQRLPSLRRKEASWPTILSSLGALYTHGAAIDWIAFDQGYGRRRVALPTYPFQRQRYWLDTGTTAPEGVAMTERKAQTPNISHNQQPAATNGAAPAASTFDQVLTTIQAMIGSVMQIAPSSLDPRTSFIDLGADSIVLMELIRKIEQTYGLQLAIRQLFEELGTPHALAEYVDQHVAPEWRAAQTAQTAPAVPAVEPALPPVAIAQPPQPTLTPQLTTIAPMAEGSAAPAASAVERVLRDQLQAMSQLLTAQLDVLRGAPAEQPVSQTPALPAPQIVQPTPAAPPTAPRAEATNGSRSTAFTTGQATGIQTRTKDLTPQQQRYLDAFIARYNQRTRKSKAFTETYRPVWADIRSTMGFRQETKELCYTLVAERSSGAHMWDIDGNRYIDVAMGFGVHFFGHSPAFIGEAIQEQLRQGIHIGPQSNLVGEVSQLVSELTGMERVTYCNSGTEAVMTAIRLARAATGRTRIAIFSDAYHGHSDHTLAIAKMVNGVRQSIPWVPGVPESVVGEVLVLPYGDPASLDTIRSHLHELAAVLVEPVQSRRPNLQPVEFLRQLRQMTAEADVTLIFDEIITGFRIHPGGAQAYFGIKADLATYGKVVGGGIPIGVVAGQARYIDRIDGGMWQYGDDSFPPVAPSFAAGTFCKHPLAMTAARAVLLRMKQEGPALQEGISQRTSRMAEALDHYFQEQALPISVAHFGSVFRFTQGNNFSYLFQPLEMDLLFYHLIERGIYLWEGRTCFLSTEHTDADVDTLIQGVHESVAELRAGGFFAADPPKSGNGSSGPSTPRSSTTRSTETVSTTNGKAHVLHTFPLTKAQRQLWALAQMGDDGMLSSKVTGALELRGPLNPDALHHAIQMVVERHETLRSTLSDHGDVQQVWSSLMLDLPLVDLSALPKADRETAITAWFEAESRKPFDFAVGPLFRTTLIRLEPRLHILVWATHHIVVDGWSITVILRELGRLYTDACGGSAAQLTPPFQFREYIAWQEQRMQSAEMAAAETFWLGQFASSIPALSLPTDHPRPRIKTYTGNRLTRRFDARFGREIKQASQESGATIFMLLLAVYNVLLHQVSGQDDLVVGVPTAGRSLDQGDAIVGYCTNVIPIRSRISAEQPFLDYLKHFRSVLFDAYQHQDYPFAELIERLNLRRDPSASPLVSVIFNLEPRVPVQKAFDLELDLITPPISFTAYDLDLNITEVGDEFILDFDYNSDLFEKTTIGRFLDSFEGLLRQFMRDANQPIGAVYQALRDQADRQEQQAARERFKKLRQERSHRSAPGSFPA
ncbi:MAG TPA: aminotransferase class III-fold pyridoxal phosphate-dependent enzyme [Herpetosiphonaceae bacterium]